MAAANPSGQGAVGPESRSAALTSITISNSGTASDTVDDATAGVNDDVATLATKINSIIAALEKAGILRT